MSNMATVQGREFADTVAEGPEADAIAEAMAMLNGTDRNRRYARTVADVTFTKRGTRARRSR